MGPSTEISIDTMRPFRCAQRGNRRSDGRRHGAAPDHLGQREIRFRIAHASAQILSNVNGDERTGVLETGPRPLLGWRDKKGSRTLFFFDADDARDGRACDPQQLLPVLCAQVHMNDPNAAAR
jgi:hypothetical protein